MEVINLLVSYEMSKFSRIISGVFCYHHEQCSVLGFINSTSTAYLAEIGENDGHTWCSVDILKAAVEDSAPECIDVFDGVLENNSFLHQYENRIGLKLYYNLEMKILSIIQERLNKQSPVPIENDKIEAGIAKAEHEQGFSYTDEQKAIIRSILTQSISFVTGKAGTGKSSILRGIIRAYSLANHNISACALSAMAAQRITEATDSPFERSY